MKVVTIIMALMALGLSTQSQAGEAEARAYCEDAARVMQLEGDKAAAYITECTAAKLAEEADE